MLPDWTAADGSLAPLILARQLCDLLLHHLQLSQTSTTLDHLALCKTTWSSMEKAIFKYRLQLSRIGGGGGDGFSVPLAGMRSVRTCGAQNVALSS